MDAFLGFVALVLIAVVFTAIANQQKQHERRQQEQLQLRALQLDDVDNMPGLEFEHYVAQLLKHKGYRVSVTRGSGDLGVDVIAEKEGSRFAVQVKRQTSNVSRRAVSDAVAGKQHYQCDSSMVITNSNFTSGARALAKSNACKLVDRKELSSWIFEFRGEVLDQRALRNERNVSNHLNLVEKNSRELTSVAPFVNGATQDNPLPHNGNWTNEDHPLTDGNSSTYGRNAQCWCGSGQRFKHCHGSLSQNPPVDNGEQNQSYDVF